MPNEPVKITAQELEEIKKLPSCQFMLGGTPQTGFFDKVNEKIYYLDSEGNWMVKRARVKKREPEKPQEEEAPAEENGEEEESGKRRWLRRKAKSDVEDESEDGRSRLDALKESLDQPLFEKIPLTRKKLLVIIGGMMVLFIIGSIASSVLFGGNDTPPNPTPIENQEPVDEPDPSLNTIQVIQVKQDLIPGDVITEDVIQSATISAESYNQITLGGTNIYQYPWVLKITNGEAKVIEQATGATTFDGKSMRNKVEVFIQVSDRDMYRMMYRVTRFIETWENAMCIPVIIEGENKKEAERQEYLARQKEGV